MSAFLCSEEHLNLIVNSNWVLGSREDRFFLLLRENIRSLEARYPGSDFSPCEWGAGAVRYAYKYAVPDLTIRGLTKVIKACDCYDYQSCEADDYYSTPAARFVHAVRGQCVASGGEEEGPMYDSLPWGDY
jgi:hypothetical protein